MQIEVNPIERASAAVGSQAELARLLGVTPSAVSQWRLGVCQVPAERCLAIEQATGGAVRCEDLRPDIPWGVVRGQSAPAEGAPEAPSPAQLPPEPIADTKSQLKRLKAQREEAAPSAADICQRETAERLERHLFGERKGGKKGER